MPGYIRRPPGGHAHLRDQRDSSWAQQRNGCACCHLRRSRQFMRTNWLMLGNLMFFLGSLMYLILASFWCAPARQLLAALG